MPGWLVLVSRAGKVAYLQSYDPLASDGPPVGPGSLFRVHSMTKPVTAVAALICYEQGLLDLRAPVSQFIASFADLRVLTGGTASRPETAPAGKPLLVWHLLTHTGGLMYGWTGGPVAGALFRRAERAVPAGTDLAGWCDAWATVPLLFEPGQAWNYSVASDVLGRVVEVASGLPLDQFFAARIFVPLGMQETAFQVGVGERARLAVPYVFNPRASALVRDSQGEREGTQRPAFLSGGAGLVSSAADYLRFAEMLRQGGTFQGRRLLSEQTVAYMTQDHMPPQASLHLGPIPAPLWRGYGLGVGTRPAPIPQGPSARAFGWSGGANTYFVVDPGYELTFMLLTQLTPFKAQPFDSMLSELVYQAITA